MSKDSSGKYHQDKTIKIAREKYQSLSKEEKSNKIVVNDTKIYQKINSWLNIEKNIPK